jgi:hypothetical protein
MVKRKYLTNILITVIILIIIYIVFFRGASRCCSLAHTSPAQFRESYEYAQDYLPYNQPYVPENQQLPIKTLPLETAPQSKSFMIRRELPDLDEIQSTGALYQYENGIP